MEHDAFIGHVADRARLSSRGDALTATRATLETLAERIPEDSAADIAAQLPKEIGLFLERDAVGAERFDAEEFIRRVAERADIDVPTATFQVRAVFDVLRDAVSAGEMQELHDSLPEDYGRLLEAGVEGGL